MNHRLLRAHNSQLPTGTTPPSRRRRFVAPSPRTALAAFGLIGASLFSLSAWAQVPPPPLPPPEDDESDFDDPRAPAPAETQPQPATSAGVSANGSASAGTAGTAAAGTAGAGATAAPADANAAAAPSDPAAAPEPWEQPVGDPGAAETTDEETDAAKWFRGVSMRRQMTLSGSTGLMRVREAGSGEAGTFRIGFNASTFSKKGFLCRAEAPCTDPSTGFLLGDDKASRTQMYGSISVTPFSWLEAYIAMYNAATSNTNGAPQSLQIVGDTNFGVKAYSPAAQDQLFYFGGDFDVYLLTGTGGGTAPVGGATGFAMHGLLTMDLHNRSQESKRIPFRAHLNLGYQFDNSGNVVKDLEQTPRPEGRGGPIERTERFGLGISRVDSFELGLAAEYVHDYFRPFFEWTLDIPVNRQGYVCNVQGAESRGDECLGLAAGLGTSPSRLTLGTRIFPWQSTGLSTTLAVDIGTGGKKRFLEETTPEAPHAFWLGLGYTIDTRPPEPETVTIAAPVTQPAVETRRYIIGRVVEANAGAAVPHALVRYDGVPMTGLVANENGEFISQDLPPGEYNFKIFAEQFREGTCTITIPETAPPEAPADPYANAPINPEAPVAGDGGSTEDGSAPADEAAAAPPAAPAGPYADADGNILVPAECKLEELPRIANITGLLVDAVSSGPVPDATVTITDKLNRSLDLQVDAQGSFKFRNVPFGTARLTASAPGYLTTVTPILIESREELKPHILMNPRPEKLAVKIGRNEVTLGRKIEFVGDTADIAISAMSIVEELAVALKEAPDVEKLEIQVHTDDSGSASYSRTLSQQRADKLKEVLVQLGVKASVLTAKGYGPDQPLAPNLSDESRARNNRVQLIRQ